MSVYFIINRAAATIQRHAVQLFGNKPMLLRNNPKFRASTKQNIHEFINDFYSSKENNLVVACFTFCWFIYYLIEIIKLHFYFGLSENSCRILSDVSLIIIYINAGFNIFS